VPLDLSVDREKEEQFLEELRRIVLDLLSKKDCRVFLFGSRARGDYRRSSDADVAVEGLSEEEFRKFKALLEELVEESSIPFTVDVVNLRRVSDSLKEEILKEGVRWK